MDFYGKLMMEDKHRIFRSPNGSGGVFVSLLRHKILKELKERGIQYVHMMGIENLLAKPLDPFFLGFAEQSKFDIVNKFIKRNDANFNKPLFAVDRDKPIVIDFNDETQESFKKKDGKGQYLFDKAYTLDTIYTVSFLEEVLSLKRKELAKNYHIVRRRIKYYDESLKETVIPLENNGYKFELYSHEILQLVDPLKFGLLETKEDTESAYIKNPDGSTFETIETARQALSNCHKQWLSKEGFKFENSNDLLEMSFKRIYDDKDPNLRAYINESTNKILTLPAYISE